MFSARSVCRPVVLLVSTLTCVTCLVDVEEPEPLLEERDGELCPAPVADEGDGGSDGGEGECVCPLDFEGIPPGDTFSTCAASDEAECHNRWCGHAEANSADCAATYTGDYCGCLFNGKTFIPRSEVAGYQFISCLAMDGGVEMYRFKEGDVRVGGFQMESCCG